MLLIAKIIKRPENCPYDISVIGYFGGVDMWGIGSFEPIKGRLKKRIRIHRDCVEIIGRRESEH